MELSVATFKAPHWVDEETMQIDNFSQAGWPRLSKLQLPVAHFVADELRGRGLEVGESKWTFKGSITFTDVQVGGKALLFSVGWLLEEKLWEIVLWSEQFFKLISKHDHDVQELERLRQAIDEILQSDPRVSHIEWHKE